MNERERHVGNLRTRLDLAALRYRMGMIMTIMTDHVECMTIHLGRIGCSVCSVCPTSTDGLASVECGHEGDGID